VGICREVNQLKKYLDLKAYYAQEVSIGELEYLEGKGFLRKEKLGDLGILFPTKKLLDN